MKTLNNYSFDLYINYIKFSKFEKFYNEILPWSGFRPKVHMVLWCRAQGAERCSMPNRLLYNLSNMHWYCLMYIIMKTINYLLAPIQYPLGTKASLETLLASVCICYIYNKQLSYVCVQVPIWQRTNLLMLKHDIIFIVRDRFYHARVERVDKSIREICWRWIPYDPPNMVQNKLYSFVILPIRLVSLL